MTERVVEHASRIDRASENAPSLLAAYAVYLLIAAIAVPSGGYIPSSVLWVVFSVVLLHTSKRISPLWSLYNALAAALFFSSFASKPFGDVHVHHLTGWLAILGLIAVSLVASLQRRGPTDERASIGATPRRRAPLPWMSSMPTIDSVPDKTLKEDTWRT